MPKQIKLNPGSQRDFVNSDARYGAYIGGVGSGKTFAGIARGLKLSQQPKRGHYGARGLAAAISYPVLMDVVLPQFFEMVDGTGLLKDYIRSEKKALLTNGAEILFRSLDQPNKLRGLELSWFFIDEGRHLDRGSWDILVGRLRQPGYKHSGWVCSTPNGYDWMWSAFHEDSPHRLKAAQWFGASTYDNRHNVGEDYITDLEATYEGKFFKQEVLGEFIPLMHGAVFPEWDMVRDMQRVEYNPDLPLYSFWDFGVGDIGVCLWAQIDWRPKTLPNGGTEFVPYLLILDVIEAVDWGAAEWANAWHSWRETHVGGRFPDSSWGDPAGKQRSAVSGTSVIDALRAHGVALNPAPKRPKDYGILILRNMMAGGRVKADAERCTRLGAALSTNRWNTDENGTRIGSLPVHDWTSHFSDALQYGATSLLSHFPKRHEAPAKKAPPGTWAFIEQQIHQPEQSWLGPQEVPQLQWHPTTRVPQG